MKKRCHRKAVTPVPPRGLRPKLDHQQQTKLGLYHVQNLDAIASGEAGTAMLWDYLEQVLVWWKVATLLGAGVPEMEAQLQIATRLAERWKRTGVVRFDGPDYQAARLGVQIADQLAAEVDAVTAMEAALWSVQELARMQAMVANERRQQREGQRA